MRAPTGPMLNRERVAIARLLDVRRGVGDRAELFRRESRCGEAEREGHVCGLGDPRLLLADESDLAINAIERLPERAPPDDALDLADLHREFRDLECALNDQARLDRLRANSCGSPVRRTGRYTR